MSRAKHTREELHAAIDELPDATVADGIVLLAPRTENRYRQKHPQKRFVLVCDDDVAARLYAQKERWFSIVVNKGHALDMMCALWEKVTNEQLEDWRDQ